MTAMWLWDRVDEEGHSILFYRGKIQNTMVLALTSAELDRPGQGGVREIGHPQRWKRGDTHIVPEGKYSKVGVTHLSQAAQ